MSRRYHVLDVFTDKALAGNALAVVLDAEGLGTAAMQAIAREFNLSETVFILPADNPAHSAKARIFTPARELPFAGHPTVGAAVCLTLERFGGDGEQDAVVVLEEGVGLVRCGVTVQGGMGVAEFDCPKLPERVGKAGAKEPMADVLGIAPAEIGFENHVPSLWSAGNPFAFVPVRDQGVLARSTPGHAGWREAFGDRGAFLYTRDTEGHDHAFRARMFAPGMGMAEDPATGSAAAAFAGAVHDFDALPDGDHSFIVEQGFEMGRPSLIRMHVIVGGGEITVVRIGGSAVRVMSGTLFV